MTIIIIIIIIIYTFLSLRLVSLVFKHVRFCVDEMCLRRINMSLKEIYIFIFFQACERAESSNSCNVIGSERGRFFTILPANPGGIVHSQVCLLFVNEQKPSFSNHFSFKTCPIREKWVLLFSQKIWMENQESQPGKPPK